MNQFIYKQIDQKRTNTFNIACQDIWLLEIKYKICIQHENEVCVDIGFKFVICGHREIDNALEKCIRICMLNKSFDVYLDYFKIKLTRNMFKMFSAMNTF